MGPVSIVGDRDIGNAVPLDRGSLTQKIPMIRYPLTAFRREIPAFLIRGIK